MDARLPNRACEISNQKGSAGQFRSPHMGRGFIGEQRDLVMSIAEDNILFSWRVGVIEANSKEIERYSHLFDSLGHWDTALEKLDLRLSAKRLREAADRLENIERQICGPATAFPDCVQAAE